MTFLKVIDIHILLSTYFIYIKFCMLVNKKYHPFLNDICINLFRQNRNVIGAFELKEYNEEKKLLKRLITKLQNLILLAII